MMALFRQSIFFVLCSFSLTAFGQISLNSTLPEMTVRICPTIEDAKAEANIAWELGQNPLREGVLSKLRTRECESVRASITPVREETSIAGFSAWSFSYQPSSINMLNSSIDGIKKAIPVNISLKPVKYYYAQITTAAGQKFYGWAELPAEPYVVEYLADQKKKNSDK